MGAAAPVSKFYAKLIFRPVVYAVFLRGCAYSASIKVTTTRFDMKHSVDKSQGIQSETVDPFRNVRLSAGERARAHAVMQRSEAIAGIAAAIAADVCIAVAFVGRSIAKLAQRIKTALQMPARDRAEGACDCDHAGGYRRR